METQMLTWLNGFIMPFFRIMGLVMTMPVFGARFVPVRIKIILSIVLSLVIVPLVPKPIHIEWLSFNMFFMILTIMFQLLIGIVLGFIFQMIFQGFVMAGHLVATQIGLGFATIMDPQSDINVTQISQFYLFFATLLFLSSNGHLAVIEMIVKSFDFFPINFEETKSFNFSTIFLFGKNMFIVGMQMSIPVIVSLLIINFALGVMTKAAPQFNIFSIGFPLMMIIGSIMVYFTIQQMVHPIENGFSLVKDFVLTFLK
jgi:flagellar biosynthetic protein FliR